MQKKGSREKVGIRQFLKNNLMEYFGNPKNYFGVN